MDFQNILSQYVHMIQTRFWYVFWYVPALLAGWGVLVE